MRTPATVKALIVFALVIPPAALFGNEEDPLALARLYYTNREYYYAVTEIKRFAAHNPGSAAAPSALLLLGKSYRMGDNYQSALDVFNECSRLYPGTPQGEESLFLTGKMRLRYGSGYYAMRDLRRYRYLYPAGAYIQDAAKEIAYVNAYNYDLPAARKSIADYMELFPQGHHRDELWQVDSLILDEINRPKKSVTISVLGSLILPGFGHFYTGKTKEGFLALASNALLGYLAADSFIDGNRFRGIFYSFIGFSFYQYSIYSAVSNVYEYNGQERFVSSIKLRLSHDF